MKIIKLPSVLTEDLNLAAINQQLRDKTVQLDWSAVVSAPQQHLAVLLAGLDISNDADVLDHEESTMSDTIAREAVRALDEPKPKTKQKRIKPPQPKENPVIWQQTNLVEAQLVASKNIGKDGQGSLIEMQFVPPQSPEPVETVKTPESPVLHKPSHYQIRAELEQSVLDDLLGPAGGADEEIDEARVSDRYLVGLLAPLHRRKRPSQSDDVLEQSDDQVSAKTGTVEEEPEQQDELAVGGTGSNEDGTPEVANPTLESMFPSSMGLSFCVSGEALAIQIKAAWGQYDRVSSEFIETPSGAAKTVWRRIPIEGVSHPIVLEAGSIEPWKVSAEREVFVRGQVRAFEDGWIISLFLINEQKEPERSPDKAWLFQPELSVESADSELPNIFVRKSKPRSPGKQDPTQYAEEQAMEMIYRYQVEFAVGHGTGVHAELAQGQTDRAVRLRTCVVPSYEVPKTDAPSTDEIPELAGLVLDMKDLAESTAENLLEKLTPLASAYVSWIQSQSARIEDPISQLQDYESIAQDALANCSRALERIRAGLNVLQTNPQALEAFQFMNEAMWEQRIHSMYSEHRRRGEEIDLETLDISKNRSWRPFQLAFILLNLPSITDLHHSERSHETKAIADLLWFPTGGGKTEAYLGLTAYTIALRRLQGTISGRTGEFGVAVLMRYTLRLLTLQQFQRATTLICACESIRRENPEKWGAEPFRIGLWVGQKTTPNRTEQSEEFLKTKLGQYQPSSSGSPHQLTNCPWCGDKDRSWKAAY